MKRCFLFLLLITCIRTQAQWIRPEAAKSPPVWGIRNGIVVGLWPAAIENARSGSDGEPRGLLRIGYNYGGVTYHINYIAVEPVVNGKIEFSEISPSGTDGKWGKMMWAKDEEITHPDAAHPEIEMLSFYIFMERYANGAHPYLRVSIRSDRPDELCLEVFHEAGSAPMERCALTATMGNYARLRELYLGDTIIDSRKLYAGFNGIGFIEKEGYPAGRMLRDSLGRPIVMATSSESFTELASWPQEPSYLARWNWRYRPFYKVTQYWRKEQAPSSLHIRVNGRAKYWSGGSNDTTRYINIPGGPSFENFELREAYVPGQKSWFGITLKTPEQLIPPPAAPASRHNKAPQ